MTRHWGVRRHLAAAMVGVAVAGVLVATLASAVAVDRGIDHFGRADLQLSADHSAGVAATIYARDGGWTPAGVADLRRLESIQGHTVVVQDAAGQVQGGSSTRQAPERAGAPVRVQGRRVGEVSIAHLGGGYLRLRGTESSAAFTEELHEKIRTHHLLAGIVAAVIGLIIAIALAVALSRPIRRLTEAAERIEAGDLESPIDLGEGSTEVRQLGRTLGRVAATLRRQDEIRRETVADLAHELRTPVSGLRGRIEAAQDGVMTDMPVVLAAMHADVLRLGRLMEDFENLAKAQQPGMLLSKEFINLGELARSRVRAFEEHYQASGIALLADIEPATTCGDAERLGQVIDNLLSNALRYTDRGGRVILRVFEGRAETIVEVADTGIGIAPEDLARIFDRFWRGEKSRSRATGGSGLGLALVRELVRAHDGRVDVESLPGRGSRFRVHLPVGVRRTPAVVEFENGPDAIGPIGARVCVARLTRDVVAGDWRDVETELLGRIREGTTHVVFDLDGISDLDARGVTALIYTQAQLRARGGRLVVICPYDSAALRNIEFTGVDQVLTIVADAEHAFEVLERPGEVGAGSSSRNRDGR